MSNLEDRTYNILVYGLNKKGLSAPDEPIVSRNYSISFEPFDTASRFNEYDAVILFKGIFENIQWKSGGYESYLEYSCSRDELDKRKKEAKLLVEKGGFICFLLDDVFIDREDGKNFEGSDLTKFHLNYSNVYRKNFNNRIAHLDIKSDEFRDFLKVYGAANSYFENYNSNLDWRVIAQASRKCSGMIISRNNYFLPTLIPDNRPEIVEEYFTLLVNGLTSSYNKLQISIPEWVKSFKFDEESSLVEEEQVLLTQLQELRERNDTLEQFKSSLAMTGEDLVESLISVFTEGFGILVDGTDELREDFKLLNNESEPFCLCEVKGVNKGVKREHINQADSHRERSGYDEKFPSLLIVNTHIRNARSVEEKDQEIAEEQIRHAVSMNILILRTIDILGLLRMFLGGTLNRNALEALLVKNSGWLRIKNATYEVITGAVSSEKA